MNFHCEKTESKQSRFTLAFATIAQRAFSEIAGFWFVERFIFINSFPVAENTQVVIPQLQKAPDVMRYYRSAVKFLKICTFYHFATSVRFAFAYSEIVNKGNLNL